MISSYLKDTSSSDLPILLNVATLVQGSCCQNQIFTDPETYDPASESKSETSDSVCCSRSCSEPETSSSSRSGISFCCVCVWEPAARCLLVYMFGNQWLSVYSVPPPPPPMPRQYHVKFRLRLRQASSICHVSTTSVPRNR